LENLLPQEKCHDWLTAGPDLDKIDGGEWQ
jgi:hypothetical protein